MAKETTSVFRNHWSCYLILISPRYPKPPNSSGRMSKEQLFPLFQQTTTVILVTIMFLISFVSFFVSWFSWALFNKTIGRGQHLLFHKQNKTICYVSVHSMVKSAYCFFLCYMLPCFSLYRQLALIYLEWIKWLVSHGNKMTFSFGIKRSGTQVLSGSYANST